jgi:hypothetical protein
MAVKTIHSFLVYPGKHLDPEARPAIGGTKLAQSKGEALWSMLNDVYNYSDEECDIDVKFTATDQQNDMRDLVLKYSKKSEMATAKAMAERLQVVTNNKPKLGLLFVMSGTAQTGAKVVISRFPVDHGITVDDRNTDELSVQFLERVFMKNRSTYKAATYQGASDEDFWFGTAVDKQINEAALSNYWVKDFLLSEFRTTAKAGSRRLAQAVRSAYAQAEGGVRQELLSMCNLAKSLDGKKTTAAKIVKQLALSDAAVSLVKKRVGPKHLFEDSFTFEYAEFEAQTGYRQIILDNGAGISALAPDFSKVIEQTELKNGQTEFRTAGKVLNDQVRKGR